jgi:cyclopropane fatty-acyl-phospholipid synthase-like methyltransferase
VLQLSLPTSLKRIFPSEVGRAFALEKVDAPLLERVLAWWHGRRVADEEKELSDDGNSQSASEDEEESGGRSRRAPSVLEQDFGADDNDGRFWTKKRIAVTEQLWGEGEITPGGAERTLEMIGAFGLGTEVNVLNIGVGLGGTSRRITGQYHGWVTGFEQDPDLAAAALVRAQQAGVAKKAEMNHAKLGDIELRANLFDCAFSRDAFYMVEDRDSLLMAVQDGLKGHCPLLFTDYFVTTGREDDPAVGKWIEAEPAPVYPWSVIEAQESLCQSNFELRVVEDISAAVRGDIFAGWATFVQGCEKTGIPSNVLDTVLELAELWGHRVAALDSGAVTVQKIVALKI